MDVARRAGVALVALVALFGCSAATTPAPSGATATPSPGSSRTAEPTVSTVGWVHWESSRYGYSIALPSEWISAGATGGWEPGQGWSDFEDPHFDRHRAPAGNPRLLVASGAIPTGVGTDDWICAVLTAGTAECSVDGFEEVAVGALEGRLAQSASHWFDVAVVADGRGYWLVFVPTAPERSQRLLLDALLASFRVSAL